MRAVEPAGQAILDSDQVQIAFAARIERRDGTVLRLISHDQDTPPIDVGFGLEVYKAMIGPNFSAMQNSADFKADNLEISGFLSDLGFTENDIRDRRFDQADVRIFYVFWGDYSISAVEYNRYTIGDGSSLEGGYSSELRSLLDYLNTRSYRTENVWCDTEFMGPRCGVVKSPLTWQPSTAYSQINPRNAGKRDHVSPTVYNDRVFRLSVAGTSGATEPTWTTTIGGVTGDGGCQWITERARLIPATIATVTDRRTFTIDPITDAPDGLLVQGLVKPTTGDNAGTRSREIVSWTLSTNEIVMAESFTEDPQIGDQLDVTLPCMKGSALGDLNCKGYANIERYVGWLHKPGDHALLNPGAV